MIEIDKILSEVLIAVLTVGLPGAFGGLVIYLYGHKKGHYRNNKYMVKLMIEVLGASITASFLVSFVDQLQQKSAIAFIIGMFWSSIIQRTRAKITAIVNAAIGDAVKERRN